MNKKNHWKMKMHQQTVNNRAKNDRYRDTVAEYNTKYKTNKKKEEKPDFWVKSYKEKCKMIEMKTIKSCQSLRCGRGVYMGLFLLFSETKTYCQDADHPYYEARLQTPSTTTTTTTTPFCSTTPYSPHFGTPALKLQRYWIPPGPSRLCKDSRQHADIPQLAVEVQSTMEKTQKKKKHFN